jgi:hypothetical protein
LATISGVAATSYAAWISTGWSSHIVNPFVARKSAACRQVTRSAPNV